MKSTSPPIAAVMVHASDVECFDEALAHLQFLGAALYRGPMWLQGEEEGAEGEQCMCQVRDPWGNCIGLRGPSSGRRQCAP